MRAAGFDDPCGIVALGDAFVILMFWRICRSLTEGSTGIVTLPSRRYWTFKSFTLMLRMVVATHAVHTIRFVDSAFGGHFHSEFHEALGQLPKVCFPKASL